MEKPWREKSWTEKKKVYKTGTVVFFFFIIFTFFQTPEYEKENLTYLAIELTEKPAFKKNRREKSGYSYWLELNPKTTDYKVSAIDYKYLRHRKFKQNIKIGDTLKIGVIGEIVLTLSKDGVEYLQFDKAQFHKQRNRLFSRYLFSTGFVLFLIPLFFYKQPKIKSSNGIKKTIDFGWIIVIGLIVCFIILLLKIGFNFVSADEFAE